MRVRGLGGNPPSGLRRAGDTAVAPGSLGTACFLLPDDERVLTHDAHMADPTLHRMLALMGQEKFTDVVNAEIQPELPIALGVIRDVEAETYDEAVRNQIHSVQEKSKVKSFDELLMTLEHWDI